MIPGRKTLRVLRNIEEDIEDVFARLIHEPWGTGPSWHPAVDLHETENDYVLTVDLPGVRPEQVELRIRPDEVTICGTRTSLRKVETAREVRLERASGRFCRSFKLEHPVKPKAAEVRFEQGVYQVMLPKEL